VEVIAHQTKGMDLPIGFGARLAQGVEKELAIRVIQENILAMIAPVHEVVNSARVLDSEFSGHGGRLQNGRELSILRTDPFPFSVRVRDLVERI